MADLCLECNSTVRQRQHAITCDGCDRWCHRKCNTGISKVVEKPFVQLWSIHGFVTNGTETKQVPLCFVLMSRRTTEDYVEVLRKITGLAQVNVQFGMLDFEAGCWAALREVFPEIQLKGCIFHWVQCVWRKVQGVGLQETYNKRKGIHEFIRNLMALPFLPADHMLQTFNRLALKANTDPLRELVSYIRGTWFESNVYAVSNISIFKMNIRTNNDCEGWHRRLNQKAAGKTLSFYMLVPLLRREGDWVDTQVQLVGEASLERRQNLRYNKINEKIMKLWAKYENEEITTGQLLKGTNHVYSGK